MPKLARIKTSISQSGLNRKLIPFVDFHSILAIYFSVFRWFILIAKSESKLNYKRGKPPDKRRHQMEMNDYTELIQRKEAYFVSFTM